jgi:hypothetical protein
MKKARYAVFEALNPFFEIVLRGLSGLVDGEHYFDTFADEFVGIGVTASRPRKRSSRRSGISA